MYKKSRKISSVPARTLSYYFPKNTLYYYGYPSGEDSGFLNYVPPASEELVAARTLLISGDMRCVIFSNTVHLADFFNSKSNDLNRSRYIDHLQLPSTINRTLTGKARNTAIKQALKDLVPEDTLIMAQPYTDTGLASTFQISPELSVFLNDKKSMDQFIPQNSMPKRYAVYANGSILSADNIDVHLPLVLKVSSSSAGDGVYICKNDQDLQIAVEKLKIVKTEVVAEQYIEAKTNYAIHFGIPHDISKPIDILGHNTQITSQRGEFLGGKIGAKKMPSKLDAAMQELRQKILPKVRELGWYGIGGIDVLINKKGEYFFIDCNFRMTGMSAFHLLNTSSKSNKTQLSFTGSFVGSKEELLHIISPYVNDVQSSKLQIIAMTRTDSTWNFNAAVIYSYNYQLQKIVKKLKQNKVRSPLFNEL